MIRSLPRPRLLDIPAETAGGLHLYRFASDRRKPDAPEVVMAWLEGGAGEVVVPVPAGKRPVRLTNMLGGEEPFRAEGNTVRFPGGPYPSYLVLE